MTKSLLIIILIIIINTAINSQTSSSLTITGGYIQPIGYLKGAYNDSLSVYRNGEDESSYFIRNGFGFGLDLRFRLGESNTLIFGGSLAYNMLQNNKDYVKNDTTITVNNKINVLSIGPLLEYRIVSKKSNIYPYAGAGLNINFFSGNETIEYTDTTSVKTLESTIRIGLQTYAGINYRAGLRIGFDFGVKYSLANLFMRSSDNDTRNKYHLNDKEAVINNKTYNGRAFQFLMFYAGVTLYLGI